jgi:hypothetical protein
MEFNLYFLAGIGLVGFIVYEAWTKSMSNIYAARPTRLGDIGTIAEYQDLGNAMVDPRNFITNQRHMEIVRREEGEFGCPRVIYKGGEKGSNIVTYGNFYHENF